MLIKIFLLEALINHIYLVKETISKTKMGTRIGSKYSTSAKWKFRSEISSWIYAIRIHFPTWQQSIKSINSIWKKKKLDKYNDSHT